MLQKRHNHQFHERGRLRTHLEIRLIAWIARPLNLSRLSYTLVIACAYLFEMSPCIFNTFYTAIFFFFCARYLSPVRPCLRIVPPESPAATPGAPAAAPAPSQPASQAAGQNPRHLKSNSLSLFYKKCMIQYWNWIFPGKSTWKKYIIYHHFKGNSRHRLRGLQCFFCFCFLFLRNKKNY